MALLYCKYILCSLLLHTETYQGGGIQGTSLGDPSILTQGTDQKSHSTLHGISFADAATATASAALPPTHSQTGPGEPKSLSLTARGGGLLRRKMDLERRQMSSSRSKGVGKVKQIQQIEGANIV